jgi:hypothetical protein
MDMDAKQFKNGQENENAHSFDLCRLTKSKESVDVCANTIRSYAAQGLRLYRVGKAVFFSKTELAAFIRSRAR